MRFHHGSREEPEINLIPFIDVLLVVLIFLMLTTTYSKYTELRINLPVADADKAQQKPREIVVAVGPDGRYAIDRQVLESTRIDDLMSALGQAARGSKDTVLIISADATASHQSVINVMDAARRVGLHQITFATQQGRNGR